MITTAAARFVNSDVAPSSEAVIVIGIQTSLVRTPVPWNPSGATPITVNGRLPMRTTRPTTSGDCAKRRVQNRWLRTTIGLAPGCSLSAPPNSRPAAGDTPSTVK